MAGGDENLKIYLVWPKNDYFHMKNCDIFIFAKNIDCRYTLEPPH